MWNTEGLKVGDEVGIGHRGRDYEFSKIAKVTASGQVTLENGMRFTAAAKEIGRSSSRYGAYLVEVEKAKSFQASIDKEKELSRRKYEAIRTIEGFINRHQELELLEKAAAFVKELEGREK